MTGPAPWEGTGHLHRRGAQMQLSQAGSLVPMLLSGVFTGLRRIRREAGKPPKPVSPQLVEDHTRSALGAAGRRRPRQLLRKLAPWPVTGGADTGAPDTKTRCVIHESYEEKPPSSEHRQNFILGFFVTTISKISISKFLSRFGLQSHLMFLQKEGRS